MSDPIQAMEIATEMTTEDMVQLFVVGVGVSAAVAIAVEKLVRPGANMLREPWRSFVLLLAPVVLSIVFTVPLLPIAVLYLAPVDPGRLTVGVRVIVGIIGGVGSSYAYNVWDGVSRRIVETWIGGEK